MTPSASEARRRAAGKLIDPSESMKGSDLVTLDHFLLDVAKSKNLDIDVVEAIESGYIERAIDAASILNVTLRDSKRVLIKGGMFGDQESDHFPAIDIHLNGLWFRLVQIQKQGDDLVLEFEDRFISKMRTHKHPIKTSRRGQTRAEFIRRLVLAVKSERIRFFSPELHKKQPIKKAKTQTEKRATRDQGLLNSISLRIKTELANKNQLENLEKILDTGTSMGANERVLLSAIITVIQESDVNPAIASAGHRGLFNQDTTPGSIWRQLGGASGKAVPDAKAYFTQAIKYEAANPKVDVATIALNVQAPGGSPHQYGQWLPNAKRILKAYAGGDIKSISVSRSRRANYEFHVGQPDGPKGEDYWAAAGRLADEVNWRRFVVGNTFFYLKDYDLMKSKPIDSISEDDDAVDTIDWDMDQGKRVAECTVKCRAYRWYAHPGEVILLEDQGPASGRWLVWTIHRDLFSSDCEITLKQPTVAKKEPAPEVISESLPSVGGLSSGDIGQDGSRQAIVHAAKLAVQYGSKKYRYGQVRPYPAHLFGTGIIVTDCSGFATLCYKAGGVSDPNGFGYNGSGNTTTLMANGTRIQPHEVQGGDLVFYRSPAHVGVYIGGGKVAEFGGDPGPRIEPVNYRSDVIGYYTYDLQAQPPFHFQGTGRPKGQRPT